MAGGDVHLAWENWSATAERALAYAFGMAGGPIPPQGLVLGRGKAQYRVCNIGCKRVHKCRPDLVDPASANEVHLFRSCSIALLLTLKRRLRVVACLLSRVARGGFTLARSLELSNQWSCITRHGPVGCLDWVSLMSVPR